MSGSQPTPASLRTEKLEAKRRKEEREETLRAARRLRAEALRHRRAKHRQRLTREILHAGRGVSRTLADLKSDVAKLESRGLPLLSDAADLAALLDIELKTLRWLTFHRDVASSSHYRQFQIPKAHGGKRTISAPRPMLRAAQQKIRETILTHLSPTAQANAFVCGRSTLTNARPHVRSSLLVKLDLEDFFGTIRFVRVRGFFAALGYSGMCSTLLALLTTEAPRVLATVDGKEHFVATGPRALPQGACTSPELSNLIASRLDRRLAGFAVKQGWVYTRYADDLAFSRKDGDRAHVGCLLGAARRVVAAEGFRVQEKKVFVARKGRQQRVTGIVVNDMLGVPRKTLRRFRAAVHRVTREGFKDRAERDRMLGYASYVRMVKPALGDRWITALRAIGEADHAS
jgi:RNA-directed DNA polymerase